MDTVLELQDKLVELYGRGDGTSLEDFLSQGCSYQLHLLRIHPERKPSLSPEGVLMREAGNRMKFSIRGYVEGAYGDRFTSGGRHVSHLVHFDTLGCIDDALVDVSLVSQDAFEAGRVTPLQKMLTAAKAYLTGKQKAVLIVADRSQVKWQSYTISGFEEFGAALLRDLEMFSRWGEDDSRALGMGSPRTCSACPVSDICAKNVGTDADVYPYRAIRARRSEVFVKKLDSYLWSLNSVPSGRPQGVIHPSEFSISPCDRRIWYELTGVQRKEEVDAQLRRIFDMGHAYHDVLQAVARLLYDDFKMEVGVYHESTKISGSCDGVREPERKVIIYEFKSISGKGFSGLSGPKTDHKKQAAMYGHPLEADLVIYVYMNKDTGQIAAYGTKPDPKLWQKLALRAETIHAMIVRGIEPSYAEQVSACYKCPFSWTCEGAKR